MRLPRHGAVHWDLGCVGYHRNHRFTDYDRYLSGRPDLHRTFPDSEKSRLAYIFMEEVVVKRSDVGMDRHTGSNHRANLPQIRVCLDDAEVARLSGIFGAPAVLDAPLREGSLREAAGNSQVRVLEYERGEPLIFDESGIHMGVKSIQSVIRGRLGCYLPEGRENEKLRGTLRVPRIGTCVPKRHFECLR